MRRVALLALPLALAACSKAPPPPRPEETTIPQAIAQQAPLPARTGSDNGGTPLKDRVATLGLLNKRNNIEQDLKMKPGETRRIGDVIVRLESCERTAPWEMPEETGAFVQVFVRENRATEQFAKIFSGWLFKESPSLNVVQNPIYDVWVKDCAMSFPEEAAPKAEAPASSVPGAAPSAKPSPTSSPSA